MVIARFVWIKIVDASVYHHSLNQTAGAGMKVQVLTKQIFLGFLNASLLKPE